MLGAQRSDFDSIGAYFRLKKKFSLAFRFLVFLNLERSVMLQLIYKFFCNFYARNSELSHIYSAQNWISKKLL